jgi:SAM-dependent methyltransferase
MGLSPMLNLINKYIRMVVSLLKKNEINDHLFPRLKKEFYLHRVKLRDYVLRFSKDLPTGKKILDFGCGNKPYSRFFETQKYYGIDGSLKSKADLIGLGDLPIKDESIDYVVSYQVLEHVPDPHKIVAEFYRVLKPNAEIVISVPFVGEYHTCPNDYWRFTHEGIMELLKNFTDIKIVPDLNRVQCLISILAYFIRSKTKIGKFKWVGHILIVALNLLGLCFTTSKYEFKTGLITHSFIASAKKPSVAK